MAFEVSEEFGMVCRKRLFASLLFLLCMGLSACTQQPVLSPSFEVPINNPKRVHEVIREALVRRHWIIIKNEPAAFEAEYKRGPEISARIRVKHIGSIVSINLVDSSGLDYQANGTGQGPMIHKTYNNWVANLERDIQMLVGAQL